MSWVTTSHLSPDTIYTIAFRLWLSADSRLLFQMTHDGFHWFPHSLNAMLVPNSLRVSRHMEEDRLQLLLLLQMLSAANGEVAVLFLTQACSYTTYTKVHHACAH